MCNSRLVVRESMRMARCHVACFPVLTTVITLKQGHLTFQLEALAFPPCRLLSSISITCCRFLRRRVGVRAYLWRNRGVSETYTFHRISSWWCIMLCMRACARACAFGCVRACLGVCCVRACVRAWVCAACPCLVTSGQGTKFKHIHRFNLAKSPRNGTCGTRTEVHSINHFNSKFILHAPSLVSIYDTLQDPDYSLFVSESITCPLMESTLYFSGILFSILLTGALGIITRWLLPCSMLV